MTNLDKLAEGYRKGEVLTDSLLVRVIKDGWTLAILIGYGAVCFGIGVWLTW